MKKSDLLSSLFMLIILSLITLSCGGGDNNITGTDVPDIPAEEEPPVITSSFTNEETTFLPGEIQEIIVEGAELKENEYSAKLEAGRELTLYTNTESSENSLLFIVPEDAVGDHLLVFPIEDQEQSLNFSIDAYEVIEDPVNYVKEITDPVIAEIEAIIHESEDADVAEYLQQANDDLTERFKQFELFNEEDQRLTARILDNIFSENSSNKLVLNAESGNMTCSVAKSKIKYETRTALKSLIGLGLGVIMAGTPVAPVGVVISAASSVALYATLNPLIDSIGDFIEACFTRDETLLVQSSQGKAARSSTSESPIFIHGEEQSFIIQGRYDIDSELSELLEELKTSLEPSFKLIPDKWIKILSKDDYEETITEDPATYSITNISDERIEVSSMVINEAVEVEFSFKSGEMPVTDQSFTFVLINNEDGEASSEIEAILKPALPVAHDMQLNTQMNESLPITLNADYAGSFNIESEPENGSLTMLDEEIGEFDYDPDQDFMGTDSFTFTAINSTGSSDIATVSIEVTGEDNYMIPAVLHGNWEYTYYDNEDYYTVVMVITADDIKVYEKEDLDTCWERSTELELDKNMPYSRDGNTFTYYESDVMTVYETGEEYQIQYTLSIEDDSLKISVTEEPENFGYLSKSDKDPQLCPGE